MFVSTVQVITIIGLAAFIPSSLGKLLVVDSVVRYAHVELLKTR